MGRDIMKRSLCFAAICSTLDFAAVAQEFNFPAAAVTDAEARRCKSSGSATAMWTFPWASRSFEADGAIS
jgi:hypothetical protein